MTEKELLLNAYHITEKYKQLAELTGENFNIFTIMGMESDEVKTHSRFLSEMLSIDGSHGLGKKPLELFLEQIKINVADFNIDRATTTCEYYVGEVTETEGGRIDILINGEGKNIIIENKIYAEDQPNQLLRYYNYDRTASLFYLTLFGEPPSESSTGIKVNEEHVYYSCISYKENVIPWLQDCYKEAVGKPMVRETISQYINLLKKLTYQNTNVQMSEELTKSVIEDKESIKSFFNLRKVEGNVKKRLTDQLINQINDKLKTRKNSICLFEHKMDGRIYSEMRFSNGLLEKNKYLIVFQFFDKDFKQLQYGFVPQDNQRLEFSADFFKLYKQLFEKDGTCLYSNNWTSYTQWNDIQNWGEEEFLSIYDGSMAETIVNKVEELEGFFRSQINRLEN